MYKEQIHGYIDFDGTLIKSHSHFKLHKIGAGIDPIKLSKLLLYGGICLSKERLGLDNSSELEKLAEVLEGLPFSETDDLVKKMELNRNVLVVRYIFPHIEPINLVVLTKNDEDLVWNGVNKIQPELERRFGIRIIDVIGNKYKKINSTYSGKIYTGEVEIKVSNNKNEFFNGTYFFGDKQDEWLYKNYNGFVKI